MIVLLLYVHEVNNMLAGLRRKNKVMIVLLGQAIEQRKRSRQYKGEHVHNVPLNVVNTYNKNYLYSIATNHISLMASCITNFQT